MPILYSIVAPDQQSVAATICQFQFHTLRGEVDAVFSLLERAIDQADQFVTRLATESNFNSLRADPRYKKLLARLNL